MDIYSQEIQEKKRDLQNQPQRIKKMAMGIYVSIITLSVNGLNAPTKRYSLVEQIQKQDPHICCLINSLETSRHIQTESERMEKYILCKWEAKESWSSNPHII